MHASMVIVVLKCVGLVGRITRVTIHDSLRESSQHRMFYYHKHVRLSIEIG